MAKVIVGGQALSLLLTLLVTPVAYTLFDDLARNVKSVYRRIFGESPAAHGFTPAASHTAAPAQGEEERTVHAKSKQSPVGLN
jgi:HAE1 family hydrophobic/amphiphilic exporter-1